MLVYKMYGLNNKKMKSFETEKALQDFMKEKDISMSEVVIIGLSLDLEYEQDRDIVYRINVLEEQDFGNYEYRCKAYLVRHILENDEIAYSWTEDFFHGSQEYELPNPCIKDFIQTKQAEDFDEERDGSPRYTIWDVYSPSELL